MRLIHDNILAKKLTEEEKTKAGVIMGPKHTKKNLAKVINVGDKAKHIQIGKTIKHYEFAGEEIHLEGEDYLLLKESKDLIGIVCR